MKFLASAELNHPGRTRRFFRLVNLLGGGILLQTTGGCQEFFSNVIDALGQPVAAGIGDGLSNLVEALVVGVFI